jgi:sugar phosphate isomerase/epimerase
MKRRDFIAVTGATALGTMINPSLAMEAIKPKRSLTDIGVQLYTVRDDMTKSAVATLRAIGAMGYNHVESAGYDRGKFYGIGAKQYKELLSDIGLKQHSGHTSIGVGEPADSTNMLNNWDRVCEDAAMLDQKYIVLGWIGADDRKTMDDYKRHAELFNKCGEKAKEYKLQFCFHNHDFEFMPIQGQIPYDYLLANTDKELVKFELDHYWTTKAKVDSIKMIAKHPGRFPLFHIKDMAKKDTKFAEVGSGRIKYPKIFAHAEKAGMEYCFVEQDTTYGLTPLESIKKSLTYLRGMKY